MQLLPVDMKIIQESENAFQKQIYAFQKVAIEYDPKISVMET